MNLFFDCEFTGLHKDTTLISLGIVSDDGKKFYAEFTDFNKYQCDEWIRENVLKHLYLNDIKDNNKRIVSSNKHNGQKSWLQKEENITFILGESWFVAQCLSMWLSQFDSIQFVSDVCHYDFVLLIDLLTGSKTALDLPDNISAVCHDINSDIARHYGISDKEAFDKSREEIVSELCVYEIAGRKHNSLYDAEVIKEIWEEINAGL